MTVYRFIHEGRPPRDARGQVLAGAPWRPRGIPARSHRLPRRTAHDVRPESSSSPDTTTGQAASKNHNIATVVHSVMGTLRSSSGRWSVATTRGPPGEALAKKRDLDW